jgi:hypothetical protein
LKEGIRACFSLLIFWLGVQAFERMGTQFRGEREKNGEKWKKTLDGEQMNSL